MLDQGTELAGLTDEAPGFGVENGMDYPLPQAEFDEDTHECRLDSYEIYLKQAEQYPILSPEQQTALAVRIQKGDEEAREQLVQSNLLLVVWVAQRHTNMGLPLLDLIQEGNIGLIKAVDRYRLNRAPAFQHTPSFASGTPSARDQQQGQDGPPVHWLSIGPAPAQADRGSPLVQT